MNTSKRLMLALAAAFGMSGVCTYALSRHMTHVSTAEHAHMRAYFAPKREIAAGEVVHAEDLQVLYWPSQVDGALAKQNEISNRVALYPLAPGQPLLDRDLSVAGSGLGLASKIPTGMRAIALKSDEVVGVAGFLSPGSHVDVLVTSKASFGTDPVTATVLQNAEVLATGQQTEPSRDGKPVTSTVVTLLLDPKQTERALLASNQGSLQFALRNGADQGTDARTPVSMSEIAPTQAPKNLFNAQTNVGAGNVGALSSTSHGLTATHNFSAQGARTHHAQSKSSGIEVIYGSSRSTTSMSAPGMPTTSALAALPAAPSAAGQALLTGMGDKR